MGILDSLGNILAGKPAFEDNGQPTQPTQKPDDNQTQSDDPKRVAEVVIDRIEYYDKGDNISINLHLKNRSDQLVFIDKIRLLGTVKEIDYNLRPGEGREFSDVYKGKRLNHNNYRFCEIDYKEPNGNYSRSIHTIEYRSKGGGIYDIQRIKFKPPIIDIH